MVGVEARENSLFCCSNGLGMLLLITEGMTPA